MIITGKARQNGSQLGAYLVNKGENENITPLEIRGSTARNVADAVYDFSLMTELTKRGRQGIYHATISPEIGEDAKFGAEDWLHCADVLEKKLGLTGQNRVVVKHEKIGKDGQLRQHLHVVWQREKEGKLVRMSHNYRQHDSARRDLETEYGHKLTKQPQLIKEQLTKIWETARDGRAFMQKAKEAGYLVTKSMKRAYTVIDQRGEKMDLVRQLIGSKTETVREKLKPFEHHMQREETAPGWWKQRKGRKAEARETRLQDVAEKAREQQEAAAAIIAQKEKEQADRIEQEMAQVERENRARAMQENRREVAPVAERPAEQEVKKENKWQRMARQKLEKAAREKAEREAQHPRPEEHHQPEEHQPEAEQPPQESDFDRRMREAWAKDHQAEQTREEPQAGDDITGESEFDRRMRKAWEKKQNDHDLSLGR